MLAWYETTASAELFLSVLTLGEIRLGIERLRRRDRPQAEALEQWLTGLRTSYRENIIGLDAATAEEWGRINTPDPLPVIDGLLAATAKVRDFALVTRNIADWERRGVKLLKPFDPPAA